MLPKIVKRNKKYAVSTEPGAVVFERLAKTLQGQDECFLSDFATERDANIIKNISFSLKSYLPDHNASERVYGLTITEDDNKRLKFSMTAKKETVFTYLCINECEPKLSIDERDGSFTDIFRQYKKSIRHLSFVRIHGED